MLILHIIIAISSFLLALGLLVRPVQKLLSVNYGLISATIVTGIILIAQGYSALHVCVMGLIYTVAMVAMSAVSRRRIVTQDV